jgi:hypothetical protein
MRLHSALLVAALAFVGQTQAVQGQTAPGLPFCPDNVSQAEMVRLVRANNLKPRCYVSEADMRSDLNRRLASVATGVQINSAAEHADFIAGLERHQCTEIVGPPPAEFSLSWLHRATNQIRTTGQSRSCRPGEVLLCDRNLNWCPYSETCWNTTQTMLTLPAQPMAQQPQPQLFQPLVGMSDSLTITVNMGGRVIVEHVGLQGYEGPPPQQTPPSIIIQQPKGSSWGWLKYPTYGIAAGVVGCVAYQILSDDACIQINIFGSKAKASAGSH